MTRFSRRRFLKGSLLAASAMLMLGSVALAEHVTFEPMPPGSAFGDAYGDMAGDVVYNEDGVDMSVETFVLGTYSNLYEAALDGVAVTHFPDQSLSLNNISVQFDLTALLKLRRLIIIGYLKDSPLPVPLEVDGRQAKGRGWTVVRWISPIP